MTLVPPPFDDPEGDVIIRSSNDVDFRFFKLFLSKASEVFHSMFQVPPPPITSPSDHVNGIPVVRVPENSELLEQLLRFCHPALQSPPLSSADQVLSFHIVAEKYNIPEGMAWSRVGLGALLDKQPTSVLVVAYHLGWQEEANAAAKRLLHVPPSDIMDNTGPEMGRVSAKPLQSFSAYRKQCIQSAVRVCVAPENNYGDNVWDFQELRDVHGYDRWEALFPEDIDCDCFTESEKEGAEDYPYLFVKTWAETYLRDVRSALRARPLEQTVHDPAIITKAVMEAQKCKECAPIALEKLQSFTTLLSKRVKEEIDMVKLEF